MSSDSVLFRLEVLFYIHNNVACVPRDIINHTGRSIKMPILWRYYYLGRPQDVSYSLWIRELCYCWLLRKSIITAIKNAT